MKFEDFVKKAVEDFLRREEKKREVGRYFPSELWSCLRKMWLTYKKPKPFDTNTLLIFHSGTMTHQFFRDVFFKTFMDSDVLTDFDYEKSLVYKGEDFEIRGRLDDLLHFRFSDIPTLLEIKSMRNLRFLKEPKEHHLLQFQFYINMIKVPRLNAYILYVDRSNLQTRIFPVEKDENVFRDIIRRAERLHSFLVKDEVPPPEAKIVKEKKWQCGYCSYKNLCNKIGEKKVWRFDKNG